MGPTALLPLQRKCALRIFITPKNPLSSARPKSARVGLVASGQVNYYSISSVLDRSYTAMTQSPGPHQYKQGLPQKDGQGRLGYYITYENEKDTAEKITNFNQAMGVIKQVFKPKVI
jgi:hypothetical protein